MANTRITQGVIKPNENYLAGIITAQNINVTGVLTYEDVTNVDSIGIITARQGIHVGAGLSVVGVSTFFDDVEFHGASGITSVSFDKSDNSLKFIDNAKLKFGDETTSDLEIYHDEDHSYIKENGS